MKTYQGSCHCKAIRLEAEIDFAEDGTGKCNCTWCFKHRYWSVTIPPERFRAISEGPKLPETGESALGMACARCGILTFARTEPTEWSPEPRVAISVAALDGLDPAELLAAPVRYCDGLRDNWWSPPDEVRHL
ncbi:GFA family protein [Pseudoroseicyclus sp. CXY001]|uniref:GFA family protein n=1 Tax=Pseudoroseicyclus sp. CXY001 TaxID=3242492 RepID=UPI00358DB304